jgi:hypothetical protein
MLGMIAMESSAKFGQICANIFFEMSSHAMVRVRVFNASTHSLIWSALALASTMAGGTYFRRIGKGASWLARL